MKKCFSYTIIDRSRSTWIHCTYFKYIWAKAGLRTETKIDVEFHHRIGQFRNEPIFIDIRTGCRWYFCWRTISWNRTNQTESNETKWKTSGFVFVKIEVLLEKKIQFSFQLISFRGQKSFLFTLKHSESKFVENNLFLFAKRQNIRTEFSFQLLVRFLQPIVDTFAVLRRNRVVVVHLGKEKAEKFLNKTTTSNLVNSKFVMLKSNFPPLLEEEF